MRLTLRFVQHTLWCDVIPRPPIGVLTVANALGSSHPDAAEKAIPEESIPWILSCICSAGCRFIFRASNLSGVACEVCAGKPGCGYSITESKAWIKAHTAFSSLMHLVASLEILHWPTWCCFSEATLGGISNCLITHRLGDLSWGRYNLPRIPSGKLTWQWKMDLLKMYSLLKMGIFHCHVRLPECNSFGGWSKFPSDLMSTFLWTQNTRKTTWQNNRLEDHPS